MSAVLSTHCSVCRKDLTDPLSRRYGIGPDCRAKMTPEQLADAIRRNQPGYIPKARPVSGQARRNHAEIERVTAPVVAAKRCIHDGIAGACPKCRHEADPWHCADRIIAIVHARREEERSRAYADYLAEHRGDVGNPRKHFQPRPTPRPDGANQLLLDAS
jgi:hypothetical protein